MSIGLETKEQLFEVMDQIAAEREAARPIVEKLVSGGEPIDDIEIPEAWRTAGFVHELITAVYRNAERDPVGALLLQQLALATARGLEQRYPQLIEHYLIGNAWKTIGHTHKLQSSYDAAWAAYRSARRSLAQDDGLVHEEACAKLGSVSVIIFGRRNDDAFQLLEEARTVFNSVGDQRRLAMVDVTIATHHQYRGELDVARAKYEEALDQLSASDDHETLAILNLNLGSLYAELGRSSDAVQPLLRSRALSSELGMNALVDKSEWGLARALLAAGQFTNAIPILRRLHDAFLARQMPEDVGLVDLDIAEALIATNQQAEARELIAKVVTTFLNANLSNQAITALGYLRDLLIITEKPREAVRHVRSFMEKHRSEPARLFLPLED
jgi:tetratricopeptide (TPR) repeat protein